MMRSLLQQLENNEAVLLMYLADELPADDRAEVEQLLASDAGMRAELETLRATNDVLTATFARGLELPPVRQAAGVRRASRAMTEFRLRRQETPAEVAAVEPRLRLPNWVYPFAAAAMILIAYVAYWGFTTDSQKIRVVHHRGPLPAMEDPSVYAAAASLDTDASDRQALATAENLDDVGSGDLGALLRDAASQIEP